MLDVRLNSINRLFSHLSDRIDLLVFAANATIFDWINIMAFNNNENGIDFREMYSAIKPHFHFPLSPYYEQEESECLESKEEYLKRELEELKLRYHQVEKSMRWWADCTANWREKWGNVKNERNKLLDEITKYQVIMKKLEKENQQFRESVKTHRHLSMEPCDIAVNADVNFCVENKILFLQEEVKRLSDLLNDARVEISRISQISSGDLCKQCYAKLNSPNNEGNYQNQFSNSISSESLESLNKNVISNISIAPNNNLNCEDRPARWRSATSGSGLISTGNASSLIVQTGCSHSSTMDQLSQKDDLTECPTEEQQIFLDQQMKTLSKQIEKLPNYNSEQE